MTYFELTSVEKDYYGKLSEDERSIYIANNEKLSVIDTVNDINVRSFVNVSRLLNELHRMHHRYNEINDTINDHMLVKLDVTADQKQFRTMVDLNEETFNMSMSIGHFASVEYLACMDECDALYRYLATVKMIRFDWLCDNFDVTALFDKVAVDEQLKLKL